MVIGRSLRGALHSDSMMLAFSNLSRSLCYLVPIPILYAYRTPADVSVWLVMTTLLALQNLLFIGVPHVLVRMLSYADAPRAEHAANEPSLDQLAQFTKVSFAVFAALLTLLFATAGTAAVFVPITHMTTPSDGWLAWALIVALSPLRVLMLRQLTYLNGRGKIADARRIDGLAWLAGGVLAGVTVFVLPSLAAMTLVMHLAIGIATFAIARLCRDNQWDALAKGWDMSGLRRTFAVVWPPIWRTGLGTLLSTGARQGTGLAFAQFGAPSSVAAYLLAQHAITVLTMLSSAPVLSRLHTMTYAFRHNDNAGLIRIAADATSRSLWIAAGLAAAIGLAIPLVAQFPQFATAFVGVELWAVLAMTLLLQRHAAAHLQVYSVTNIIVWHWLDGATGVISVALAFLLIPLFGVWGAAISGLIGIAAVYAWVPLVLSHRRFGIPFPQFALKTSLAPFATFVLVAAVAIAIARFVI